MIRFAEILTLPLISIRFLFTEEMGASRGKGLIVGPLLTGKEILHRLELARFNLDDIQIDDDHPTGSVKVKLDKSGTPEFDIISEVAYDYIKFIPEYHLNIISNAKMIYFGSLVQRGETGFENLQAFISHNSPEILNFYDSNRRPGCYNNSIIEKSL